MSGVLAATAWGETAEELYGPYTAEADVATRKRLQALWLVRSGERVRAAARQAGVGKRTVVRWLGWYRRGGLAAVLDRTSGHEAVGAPARLSEDQQWLLVRESARGPSALTTGRGIGCASATGRPTATRAGTPC